jgi:hypothetical protein
MIHGVHQAFLVLGLITVVSSVVFMELHRDDGGAVSRHAAKQKEKAAKVAAV